MDEQSQELAGHNPDQPLATLSEKEQAIEAKPEPEASDEPVGAVARLRAFEDANFGVDAVRIQGRVERGFGSPFKEMPEAKHRHYAALENLIVTEQALADAHSALIAAEEVHNAALALADETEADASA